MNYNQIYKQNTIWGKEGNELLEEIFFKLDLGSYFLDLGCGQGRDSLFMLTKGFKVDAVDISSQAIKEIKKRIKLNKLNNKNINLFNQDIGEFKITEDKYSIINAFNSLQFLSKIDGLKVINNIKKNLRINGYVIISGFTVFDFFYNKKNLTKCFFNQNELKDIFSNFNIIKYQEIIIEDKGHEGFNKAHKHAIVQIIAQKI